MPHAPAGAGAWGAIDSYAYASYTMYLVLLVNDNASYSTGL